VGVVYLAEGVMILYILKLTVQWKFLNDENSSDTASGSGPQWLPPAQGPSLKELHDYLTNKHYYKHIVISMTLLFQMKGSQSARDVIWGKAGSRCPPPMIFRMQIVFA